MTRNDLSDIGALIESPALLKNIRAKFQKYGENPIETVWGLAINGSKEK